MFFSCPHPINYATVNMKMNKNSKEWNGYLQPSVYDRISKLMTPIFRRGSRCRIIRNEQIKSVQDYDDQYPTASELHHELVSFTFMHLLNTDIYPRLKKGRKARFTLSYQMHDKLLDGDEKDSFMFTLSTAVWLTDNLREGNPLYPKEDIFAKIVEQVKGVGENYDANGAILAVCVTGYCEPPLADIEKKITEEESILELCDIYIKYNTSNNLGHSECTKPDVSQKDRNNRFPSYRQLKNPELHSRNRRFWYKI